MKFWQKLSLLIASIFQESILKGSHGNTNREFDDHLAALPTPKPDRYQSCVFHTSLRIVKPRASN